MRRDVKEPGLFQKFLIKHFFLFCTFQKSTFNFKLGNQLNLRETLDIESQHKKDTSNSEYVNLTYSALFPRLPYGYTFLHLRKTFCSFIKITSYKLQKA